MARLAGKPESTKSEAELNAGEHVDAALEEALKNFRMSVHAWSDAAMSRPRTAQTVRHRSWRLAVGWALAGVLLTGGLSGGMFERQQRIERERIAAARLAEQQKVQREQRAMQDDEDLLAKVDSDVSREVPSAMEPLAQLMNDGAK
jgi:hypothetical protein